MGCGVGARGRWGVLEEAGVGRVGGSEGGRGLSSKMVKTEVDLVTHSLSCVGHSAPQSILVPQTFHILATEPKEMKIK